MIPEPSLLISLWGKQWTSDMFNWEKNKSMWIQNKSCQVNIFIQMGFKIVYFFVGFKNRVNSFVEHFSFSPACIYPVDIAIPNINRESKAVSLILFRVMLSHQNALVTVHPNCSNIIIIICDDHDLLLIQCSIILSYSNRVQHIYCFAILT